MTRTEIEKTLYAAMEREFEIEPENLTPQANIKTDLGLDSLDIVDMVVVLEAAFNFKIRDKGALLKIETIGDVTDFIETTQREVGGTGETCAP